METDNEISTCAKLMYFSSCKSFMNVTHIWGGGGDKLSGCIAFDHVDQKTDIYLNCTLKLIFIKMDSSFIHVILCFKM